MNRAKKETKPIEKKPEAAPPKPAVLKKPAAEPDTSLRTDWRRILFGPRPPAPNKPVPSKPARVSAAYASLGLQPTSFTPYDRFLDNVWPVLKRLDDGEASMLRALRMMEKGRSFSYLFTDPYRPQSPEFTASKRSGDCKSKALWLCAALGDPNVLWVVGKKTRNSAENHCWVYWRSEGRWYVLDCTENSRPLPTDEIPRDHYIPYYSFGKGGAFRHAATRIQLSVQIPLRSGFGWLGRD